MSKKALILPCLAAFLVLLFLMSFIPGINGKNSEKFTKTCLLNQKNAGEVSEINLFQNGSGIRLFKNNGVWTGTSPSEYENLYGNQNIPVFPVDQKQVENLIQNLTDIRKMYTLSDTENADSVYETDEEKAFRLDFNYGDNRYTEIYAGKSDFSRNYRYVRLNQDRKIYRLQWNLDSFMHTEYRFWYDPYILPEAICRENGNILPDRFVLTENGKNFIKNKDEINIEKLMEFRHGSLYEGNTSALKKTSSLKVETSEGKDFYLNFYAYDDQDMIICYQTGENWNYSVFVSQWTYSKLAEIFKENKDQNK